MATPPFNILEAKPADSDIVAQFPADERSNRDVIESAIGIEHGIGPFGVEQGGRHRFGVGNDATRNAITTWEVGSIWLNTATSPAKLQRVVSINPDVWEDVAAVPSSTSFTTDITITSTDAGAARGPGLTLDRDSASPAANDVMGFARWVGEDSAGNDEEYARMQATLLDPTSTSEDARLDIGTVVAGTLADRLRIGAGVFTPNATGGDKGADSINASALYDDDQLVVANIDGLTIANNPASTAFVAGSIGAGATNNRKFRVGEVGGWCALEEQIASASATLDFVLTSYLADFEDFEFILHSLLPATDAQALWVRTSTDGGSTYGTASGTYRWTTNGRAEPNALDTNQGSGATGTRIQLTAGNVGNAAGEEGVWGKVFVVNPAAALRAKFTWQIGYMGSAGEVSNNEGQGIVDTAADVDAIRFLFASGNITSGKITLMGRHKVT